MSDGTTFFVFFVGTFAILLLLLLLFVSLVVRAILSYRDDWKSIEKHGLPPEIMVVVLMCTM